jgi:hypothetical protein
VRIDAAQARQAAPEDAGEDGGEVGGEDHGGGVMNETSKESVKKLAKRAKFLVDETLSSDRDSFYRTREAVELLSDALLELINGL